MKTHLLIFAVCAAAAAAAQQTLSQGYAPREAVKHMTTAKGLKVSLFASEPDVRQAIFVKCDDRGRLWTIQYLQYPNPAGLKRVNVDRWSRTVYDRVPEPPPHGPRGADKITIMEDTDGDGHADKFHDFVDGLNIATGVEFGHGGVFVLNPPYLLFYPDKNRDDVPDSDPQVLLMGFGMEDAQAMSNHLTWGPDGWLYGVNGSTTTCHIRGLEFQQGLWRYQPLTHEFELFCEGGSNCYGVTFDANGECFYSTNAGPFVHAVQGGYYYKAFGKHGPLHNLFAYHFFPELERDQVPGGPPTGGTMYLADAFPEAMRNAFIAGNFLGHTVSWWTVTPTGSTVRATYGGVLLDSHDDWCGPTDVCLAPDGSVYVSDFFDQRTAHPDPDANWDRSDGRIYKISAETVQPAKTIDIGKLMTNELVDLLAKTNHWYATRARLELAIRRDPSAIDRLRAMATQTKDSRLALEGLWALHATADLDDRLVLDVLKHPYPYVRFWAVRLVGDQKKASHEIVDSFVALASSEESPVVRGQLAATAKRLPAQQGLPIVDALLRHDPNESDPRVPWLVWWAIESKVTSDASLVVETFAKSAMWTNPAARDNVLRLIRRFAAEGTPDSYNCCFQLLQSAPADYLAESREQLRLGLAERSVGLRGIGQGDLFEGQAADDRKPSSGQRHYEPLAGPLRDYIEKLWREEPHDQLRLELALRAALEDATAALMSAVFEPAVNPERRVALLHLLREFGDQYTGLQVVKLVQSNQPEPVRLAALDVLAKYGSDDVTQALLAGYAAMTTVQKAKVREVLFSRPASALAFLKRVDAGNTPPDDVSVEQLRHLALHEHKAIDDLVRKHWGNIGPGTAEEKLATMRRFNNDLRAGTGDRARGKALFTKSCAVCHQMDGEGNKVGPDLTTANRQDLAALLGNIVDPSAVIRREYMSYVVVTDSGRVYNGLLTEQDGASITILDAKNERFKLSRDEVETLDEAKASLMPERILDTLTPQEVRDLFAYVQAPPLK